MKLHFIALLFGLLSSVPLLLAQDIVVEKQKSITLTGKIEYLTFSPDGSLLAAALTNGSIALWQINTSQEPQIIEAHQGMINHVAFSHSGKLVASASNDGTVKLWDAATGQSLKTWQNATPTAFFKEAYFVEFSNDDKQVYFGGKTKKIKRGTIEGQNTDTETVFEGNFDITIGRISQDGKFMAFANGYAISFLNLQTNEVVRTLEQKINDYINDLVFSNDGKYLAAWCEKGLILLWDYPQCNFIKTIDAGNKGYSHLTFAADNNQMASGNLGPAFRVWDVKKGTFVETIGHTTKVNTFAFNPTNPTQLATGSYDRTITLWHVGEKQTPPPPPAPEPVITTPIVEETVPALAERQIISKANFIVASPNISINIWDDRREDGDIVSLFFNGEAVLEEYKLENKVKTIKLVLGINRTNTLVLYAHNLGEQPPNTAAISINDGKQTRRITLSSDFEGSEAITIEYKPE